MNIFIYGSKSFKKEIHSVLDHANIKFKLDEDSVIKDLDTLELLKSTIEESPHDIYLIEEEKIIKKNSLNSKVKFLTPKDGVDEDFLLEHSIPDITIDSLADLPKYIIKKHDEYLEERESQEVQNEIIEIVDDAYSNDNDEIIDDELGSLLSKDDEKIDDFENDGFDEYKFDENIEENTTQNNEIKNQDDDEVNIVDFEKELENIDDLIDNDTSDLDLNKLDDELNLDDLDNLIDNNLDEVNEDIQEDDLDDLLADLDIDDSEENNLDEDLDLDLSALDSLDEIIDSADIKDDALEEPNFSELENKLEEISLNESEFEENDDKIDEIDSLEEINNISETQETTNEIEEIKGEEMNDDFSQLDSITEEELLEALGDTSTPSPTLGSQSIASSETNTASSNNTLEVSSNNIEDLTKLFTQLLNNKTLEITIKIKD